MNQVKNLKLRFEGMIAPSRVRVATVTDDIQFETHHLCECCKEPLKPFATLSSISSGKIIRVGVCDSCGYTGYIDRPSKEWIVSFYANEWDQVAPRTVEDIRSNPSIIGGKTRGSRLTTFEVYKLLPTNTSRAVLDIGSGYGQVLKGFYDAGFKSVYGVENSHHRAERVHEAFGFDILEGDFGGDELSQKLKEHAPFGLVFSHHVLEHTYHPADVIREVSSLQDEGDVLILALPNDAEHILYQALYLPHLHTFTPESLEVLLNKNGYEVLINNTDHDTSIIFGAIKKKNPVPRLVRKSSYFLSKVQRLKDVLRVGEVGPGDWYELFWEQREGDTNFSKHTRIALPETISTCVWKLRSLYWFVRTKLLKRFRPGYWLLLQRLQDEEGEGIKIEYEKNIQMMLK